MFKNLVINLTEPICSCERQALRLWLSSECIAVECCDCNIKINIPAKSIKWSVNIDKKSNKNNLVHLVKKEPIEPNET